MLRGGMGWILSQLELACSVTWLVEEVSDLRQTTTKGGPFRLCITCCLKSTLFEATIFNSETEIKACWRIFGWPSLWTGTWFTKLYVAKCAAVTASTG